MSAIQTDRLPVDLINLTVIVFLIILLLRTASALEGARFLAHFAYSFALMGLYYFSSAATTTYKLVLANSMATSTDLPELLEDIGNVGELTKILFSSLSSCFLLITWDLVRRYPNEGVSKGLFTAIIAGYLGVPAAVPVFWEAFGWKDKLTVLTAVDSLFACIAVLMVGWALRGLLASRPEKVQHPVLRDLFGTLILVAFLAWGIIQPLYPWSKDTEWFWVALATCKLACGLVAILAAVYLLEEKRIYRAGTST